MLQWSSRQRKLVNSRHIKESATKQEGDHFTPFNPREKTCNCLCITDYGENNNINKQEWYGRINGHFFLTNVSNVGIQIDKWTSSIHKLELHRPQKIHSNSYLRVRSEVGRVHFSSWSSDRASDIFSLNRYKLFLTKVCQRNLQTLAFWFRTSV